MKNIRLFSSTSLCVLVKKNNKENTEKVFFFILFVRGYIERGRNFCRRSFRRSNVRRRTFRRKDLSPYGFFTVRIIHRVKFSPYGFFALRNFRRTEILPCGTFSVQNSRHCAVFRNFILTCFIT